MRIQRVTESNKSRDPDYKNRLKMKHRSNKRTGMCTEPRERSARSRRKKGCSWGGEENQDTVWERTCTASPALCQLWLSASQNCLGLPWPLLTTAGTNLCHTEHLTLSTSQSPGHGTHFTGDVRAVTGQHNGWSSWIWNKMTNYFG